MSMKAAQTRVVPIEYRCPNTDTRIPISFGHDSGVGRRRWGRGYRPSVAGIPFHDRCSDSCPRDRVREPPPAPTHASARWFNAD